MQLTTRDLNILHFINDMGFCEMPQIRKKFAMKKSVGYDTINRLVFAGLIKHKRLFHLANGIYYLTRDGAAFTSLPAIEKISLGGYHHQIMLTNVCIKLTERYPHAIWKSERQIKNEKYSSGKIGEQGHIPDGLMTFPDGKIVAIEVELTMKSKFRLQKIMRDYAGQFNIKEVWYFCSTAIHRAVVQQAERLKFITVKKLEELLQC